METSTFWQISKKLMTIHYLKNISSLNRTEKSQACIQLGFHFQNLRIEVANRLQAHIKSNHPHVSSTFQSAYRKHHSTESGLMKVHNDIIISMD